jgi:hypothetical protein
MPNEQLTFNHPLAEVFGFKTTDHSTEANTHRGEKLCRFNNVVPRCTKSKKDNPLGVCSIFAGDQVTIICPVRFREDWKVCKDAADFFFPRQRHWTPVKEIRLKERSGRSAGNIDIVIVAHDESGRVTDFGAVEVQAVYVSGNITRPFEHYMSNPVGNERMDWRGQQHYPRPDFLSSSRKRLGPQLQYKGQIMQSWDKKLAVVVDSPFFQTMPVLDTVAEADSDLCWLVYILNNASQHAGYSLTLNQKIYTGFGPTMKTLGTPEAGSLEEFMEDLGERLAVELAGLREQFGVSSFSELLASLEPEMPPPNLPSPSL